MTVPEMRDWLRNWIANATGQSADAIDDSTPMVELGLSSRDAVAMASDIEDLTGVTADGDGGVPPSDDRVVGHGHHRGRARTDDDDADSFDWSRDVDKDDIAIVGLSTRFPGDMNTPTRRGRRCWRPRRDHRPARGPLVEFLEEPRIAERVAKACTRGGYLSDIKGFDAEFFALSKMEADNIDRSSGWRWN